MVVVVVVVVVWSRCGCGRDGCVRGRSWLWFSQSAFLPCPHDNAVPAATPLHRPPNGQTLRAAGGGTPNKCVDVNGLRLSQPLGRIVTAMPCSTPPPDRRIVCCHCCIGPRLTQCAHSFMQARLRMSLSTQRPYRTRRSPCQRRARSPRWVMELSTDGAGAAQLATGPGVPRYHTIGMPYTCTYSSTR